MERRFETIRFEVEEKIGILTLDRPEQCNAMSASMAEEFSIAIECIRKEEKDLRVLVIKGNGKCFAAGGDFSFIRDRIQTDPQTNREIMIAYYRSFLGLREVEIPTVALIHGAAIGAGLCLALACDIRYAARGAKLGANFTRLGLHPGMAATLLLPELVGIANAKELIYTGRIIDAERAERIGLVNMLFDKDDLFPAGMDLAKEIAISAPLAVRKAKVSLNAYKRRTLDDTIEAEAISQANDFASADIKEGVNAAMEKRLPCFEAK